MKRNLVLLSYYFPPGNIIGAVRPYQIASYFLREGWNVHVICCQDDNVPDNYWADVTGIVVHRLTAPRILVWLNKVGSKNNKWLSKISFFISRAIRLIIRSLFFPESFVLVKRAYISEIEKLVASKNIDLLISSSKPFAMHTIAHSVACKHGIPWVADNRDLWADSPYRRNIIPRRKFDMNYERAILKKSKLVLGVSQGMIDFYNKIYGINHTRLVMNGYEERLEEQKSCLDYIKNKKIDIVYGGMLYGYLRNPSVLFQAVENDEELSNSVRINFYGSEEEIISSFSSKFTACEIKNFGRVSKNEISRKYQSASVLLVILGSSDFENGVMTGKFFEYLTFGKPILAIASEKTELAKIINESRIGLATKDSARIASFLKDLKTGRFPSTVCPPNELSINYQLSALMDSVKSIL